MARPSTGHVRSHDAATHCRASRPARTPRRRPRIVADNGGFGVYFEHMYTSINGVANHDIDVRGSSSAICLVARVCSIRERSDDTRHVAALAIHRLILIPSMLIHDSSGSGSRPKTCCRLISWQTKRLTRRIPSQAARRFFVNNGQPVTQCTFSSPFSALSLGPRPRRAGTRPPKSSPKV